MSGRSVARRSVFSACHTVHHQVSVAGWTRTTRPYVAGGGGGSARTKVGDRPCATSPGAQKSAVGRSVALFNV